VQHKAVEIAGQHQVAAAAEDEKPAVARRVEIGQRRQLLCRRYACIPRRVARQGQRVALGQIGFAFDEIRPMRRPMR